MSPIATGRLLGHAKNLQSLLITITSLHAYPTHIRSVGAIPLATVIDILEVNTGLASSLKELALLEPLYAHFTNPAVQVYHSIHADFSFLKHLQVLKITLAFWYNRTCELPNAPKNAWMWKKQDRCAVRAYSLVPLLLRELEIQFMWPEVVFASGEGLHEQFLLTSHTTQLKGFGWIREFADQKQRREGVLPELGCLRLTEFRENSGYRTPSPSSPPELMREVFEGAGIELVIRLARYRKKW
jgi:hypothetical protein